MDSSVKESAILIVDDSLTTTDNRLSSNELNLAQNELQFHSFIPSSNTNSNSKAKTSSVYSSSAFDESNNDEEDVLLGQSSEKSSKASSVAFWQMEYFGQYFDVTTSQVLSRILWSLLPISAGRKGNYIERHIQPTPDLYGPFWISSTLVFSIAICGNIVNYINSWGHVESIDEWHYDYAKVGLAASTIFTYVLAVPIALWFFFWFRGCTTSYTLFETICVYGYSLSIYVPISILWVINIRIIQLILVAVGALLSGSVLVITFAPVVHSDPSKTIKSSYFILILIIVMHALLAIAFLEYFFWFVLQYRLFKSFAKFIVIFIIDCNTIVIVLPLIYIKQIYNIFVLLVDQILKL